MGKPRVLIYVPSRLYQASIKHNFRTSYEGINNFAALLNKYTGISFIADDTGSKWDTTSCGRFASANLTKYIIPANVYQFIINDLALQINDDFNAATSENSDPAFLITLFMNITSLKTTNWTTARYTDAITYFGSSSFFIPCRISPKTEFGANLTINGIAGTFGSNSIANGVNAIKIIGLTNFVGKAYTVSIFNFNGSGITNSLGTASGTVDGSGNIIANIDITYTSGQVFFKVNSLAGINYDDFGGNVFQPFNFGYGANYTNINLERSDIDGTVPLIFG